MTVLAPKTTGISYTSEKELEMMKQLYDVDKLFDEATNMGEVRESFINIANREIAYRNLEGVTYEDVLNDIEEFTKGIIYRKDASKLEKIVIGMRQIVGFMLEKKFLIDREVLTCASKVDYLIYVIRNNAKTLEKYQGHYLLDVEVPEEHRKRIGRIKKANEEAYYYITKKWQGQAES